ncbi:MAG: tetratricopeptide repeat protein [Deltaproteobacteria bacterium]|nr:tetratricopeptide repeat protein [Deltaproteobacteria bacterium]
MTDRQKNLLASLAGCSLLLLLEVVLAVLGVMPLSREDPFVGFEGTQPLFVRAEGGSGTTYVLNPIKRPYFNEQSFQMPKPGNTFRIVSFGGSTTYGQPYINNTSFTAWTARVLQTYDGARAYESVNAGGISYASYRVRRLMEELAQFSPDLYVVYSGHNEFLERRTFGSLLAEKPALRRARAALHRSRIYSVALRAVDGLRGGGGSGRKTLVGDGVSAILEQVAGPELYHRDPTFREGVIRQYRYNLESMARLSKEKGIPLVLCTLPSNLSGVSPFKSEHRAGLDEGQLTRWKAAFSRGEAALGAGRCEEALAALAEAERIDDAFAQLHFLKGRALVGLGRTGEAYVAYDRAKEEDVIPLRALDAFNDAVRDVARREGVALADVETVFRRWSPGGIPGPTLFEDHVHPTLEGQQAVALLVVDAAAKAGVVPLSAERWLAHRAEAANRLGGLLAAVSPRYRAMGSWVVGRTYYWAGKNPEAQVALKKAWDVVRDVEDIPHKLGSLEMEQGNFEAALPYLLAAARLAPEEPRIPLLLALARIGLRQGGDALGILDRIGPVPPDAAPGYHTARADALRILGRTAEARRELETAKRVADAPGFREGLANAYARLGDRETAEAYYREFLRLTGHPDPPGALAQWRVTAFGRSAP